jgi:hypothetical protein
MPECDAMAWSVGLVFQPTSPNWCGGSARTSRRLLVYFAHCAHSWTGASTSLGLGSRRGRRTGDVSDRRAPQVTAAEESHGYPTWKISKRIHSPSCDCRARCLRVTTRQDKRPLTIRRPLRPPFSPYRSRGKRLSLMAAECANYINFYNHQRRCAKAGNPRGDRPSVDRSPASKKPHKPCPQFLGNLNLGAPAEASEPSTPIAIRGVEGLGVVMPTSCLSQSLLVAGRSRLGSGHEANTVD